MHSKLQLANTSQISNYNTSRRNHYYNKRILLSESFDMNYPVDEDSDTDTEALSSIWLNSDLKSEHFEGPENSERDISIDDNISMIGKFQENLRLDINKCRSKEHQPFGQENEDSISQMISTSFLEELKEEDAGMNEEERLIQQQWEKQIKLQKLSKNNTEDFQDFGDIEKPKMELSYTPRYTKHDVYYLFQYHFIEHAIDWLFLPEEPYILIELLSDQQAIYANQTLSIITDKMPEGEIMPCYFAFKGMISLFVSDFPKAFNYFDKASLVEDNILFLFWRIVAKFYIWNQSKDYEDFAILKLLVGKFERLSHFNVNIKWIRLRIKLYEYIKIDKSDFALNKARDSALEIKSLNQYLGYIAWAEIYATTGQMDKCMEVLYDCIKTEPNKTYAYIRLYHFSQLLEDPPQIFGIFLKIYLFLNDTADLVEKHSEVRHRLVTLLFIRVCALENRTVQAINTICRHYKEDGDKLSLLMEFARIVTQFGNIEYVGEAMGVLEEIEMRGCIERNRDVYFLMAQIEILRGNIMIGYKLFMEALNHLDPVQDKKRINYIESFVLPYKINIEKAIELEKLIEENTILSLDRYDDALKDLELVQEIDRKYSDVVKLKLHACVLKDPIDLIIMIDEVYKHRYTDIKLCIYYFEMAFQHKDLTTMVYLRDQLILMIENNETISTCEYVRALDLIYHTYDFQGKFRNAIEILDRINSLVPALPNDYDLDRVRKLIHCCRDETSEDTEDYNIRAGPVPLLDFTQIEKINISKLIMKEGVSARQDQSMMSDRSPERKTKTARENFISTTQNYLFDYEQSADNLLKIAFRGPEEEAKLDPLENSLNEEKKDLLNFSESDKSIDQITECDFVGNDVTNQKNITFRSFSDPKYYLEKGRLLCRIVLDYHSKRASQKEAEENGFPDLISFEDTRDDEAMQALTSRDFNELLEEGLEALVEYLLNLFYRKQYYPEEGFESKKEKAFFWITVVLFKLKRYEESLDLIKRYSHKWKNSEKFIDTIIRDMMEEYPPLREKYAF